MKTRAKAGKSTSRAASAQKKNKGNLSSKGKGKTQSPGPSEATVSTSTSRRKRAPSPVPQPPSKRAKHGHAAQTTTAASSANVKAKSTRVKPADIISESEPESEDETGAEDNDDGDLAQMDRDTLQKQLASERVVVGSRKNGSGQDLFASDNDVEVVSTRGKPALSTSSDIDEDELSLSQDSEGESEDESEEGSGDEMNNKKPTLSARARARMAEAPKFRALKGTTEAPLDIGNDDVNAGWHVSAHYNPIKYPSRVLKAYNQPIPLKNTIKAAIRHVIGDVLFVDAFPSADSAEYENYHRTVLVDVAKRFNYRHLADRLKRDDELIKHVAVVINGRVTQLRSQCYHTAYDKIEGYYLSGSDPAEDTAQKRDALIDHKQDFLYPSKANGSLDTDWPFFHPAIISSLKKCFFTGDRGTIAKKHDSRFSSSIGAPDKRQGEREIPIAMISLVAAMTYAALKYWTGSKSITRKFRSEDFEDNYRAHTMFLESLMKQKPNMFHRNMHKLYSLVADTTRRSAVIVAQTTMSRITVQDDIEVDD